MKTWVEWCMKTWVERCIKDIHICMYTGGCEIGGRGGEVGATVDC